MKIDILSLYIKHIFLTTNQTLVLFSSTHTVYKIRNKTGLFVFFTFFFYIYKATSTNSNKDTGAHLAKEQQRGKRDVVGSRPPTSPCPPHHSDVQVGHQRPQK